MCNLYSITKGQAAIIAFTRAMRDLTGNLPPMPGVFPDYAAPIIRNAPEGVRELILARWGMPGPPQFGGAPITNIRNTAGPHWRAWLNVEHRCVVPFNSFCEYSLFILEVVKAYVAVRPKYPQTIHYRGDGVFMISGENTGKFRKLFKKQNL
jgi:putative SOS response-associated peptidase YedK